MDSKPSGTIADNVSDQSDTVSTIIIEDDSKQNAENIQKLQVNSNCKKYCLYLLIIKLQNGLTIRMLMMIIICAILIAMGFCVSFYGELKMAKNEKDMEVKITKLIEGNDQLKEEFESKTNEFNEQIKKVGI
jgi:type III secretory pathway component EscU